MTGPLREPLFTMLGMALGGAVFTAVTLVVPYYFFRGSLDEALGRWLNVLLAVFAAGLVVCCAFIAYVLFFDLSVSLGHTPFFPMAGGAAAGTVIVLAFLLRERRRNR